MQAVKNAAASAKEKASSITAKVEEKLNMGKAHEKTDKVLASEEPVKPVAAPETASKETGLPQDVKTDTGAPADTEVQSRSVSL